MKLNGSGSLFNTTAIHRPPSCSLLDSAELHVELTADDQIVLHPCCLQWLSAAEDLPRYSIDYLLENYDSDSIYDFLNLELARLRGLYAGGAFCKQPLVCCSNSSLRGAVSGSLRSITLSTTRQCNLKCVMCTASTRQPPSEKVRAFNRLLLAGIKGKGLRNVWTTLRGEPFASPGFLDWCESLSGLDTARLSILTNGTLIDPPQLEAMAASLAARGVQLSMSFSLDATTAEAYEAIRGVDAFERVAANIRLCKALKMLDNINFTVIPGVNEHELPQLAARFEELGLIEPTILPESTAPASAYRTETLTAMLTFSRILNMSRHAIQVELLRRETL